MSGKKTTPNPTTISEIHMKFMPHPLEPNAHKNLNNSFADVQRATNTTPAAAAGPEDTPVQFIGGNDDHMDSMDSSDTDNSMDFQLGRSWVQENPLDPIMLCHWTNAGWFPGISLYVCHNPTLLLLGIPRLTQLWLPIIVVLPRLTLVRSAMMTLW